MNATNKEHINGINPRDAQRIQKDKEPDCKA